jgi:hypothetical protein
MPDPTSTITKVLACCIRCHTTYQADALSRCPICRLSAPAAQEATRSTPTPPAEQGVRP